MIIKINNLWKLALVNVKFNSKTNKKFKTNRIYWFNLVNYNVPLIKFYTANFIFFIKQKRLSKKIKVDLAIITGQTILNMFFGWKIFNGIWG